MARNGRCPPTSRCSPSVERVGPASVLTAAGRRRSERPASRCTTCAPRTAVYSSSGRREFVDHHAGSPLKNVALSIGGVTARGDAVITSGGLEGGPVYALSAPIRHALDHDGSAALSVDLQPDLRVAQVEERLRKRRPKDSMSSTLKRTVGLSPTTIAWLREVMTGPLPHDAGALAALLKAVPLAIGGLAAIDRAISSAGGVSLDEVDESFMLRRMPGTFVVGEMLDWEAPTGGYLLQATFSTAVAAARGAVARLAGTP